eukprot:349801-Chlamydomonas_euryale.AAC.50
MPLLSLCLHGLSLPTINRNLVHAKTVTCSTAAATASCTHSGWHNVLATTTFIFTAFLASYLRQPPTPANTTNLCPSHPLHSGWLQGLGIRSRRYAMLLEDSVIKMLNLEEGGAFTISSADNILEALA